MVIVLGATQNSLEKTLERTGDPGKDWNRLHHNTIGSD